MSSSRRSLEMCSQIDSETDIIELEKKRRALERMLCDEFKEIYERQNDFEKRLSDLEKPDEMKSPLRVKSHEEAKFTDLQQKIEATSDSCTRLIDHLKSRVENLEKENRKLVFQNKDLEKLIDANNVDDDLIRLTHQNRELRREIEIIKLTNDQNATRPENLNTDRIAKINIEIPKFKGTMYERPMKYLNELVDYINIKKASFNEIKLILNQSLENEAKDWWYINEDEVDSFDDFTELFKDRFWCSNVQRKIKRKIECGQYMVSSKISRVSYATHLVSLAKDLNYDYSDDELINLISEQFEREIKYAIKSNAKSKNDLFKILTEFDQDRKQFGNLHQNYQNENDKNDKEFTVIATEIKNDQNNKKSKEKKEKTKETCTIKEKSKLACNLYENIDVLDIDLDRGNGQ